MAGYTLFPSILPTDDAAIDEVADEVTLSEAEHAIANNDCPFCDAYDGTHPTNHAPKAHPNRWEAYKRAREAATAPPTATDAQTTDDHALTDGGE